MAYTTTAKSSATRVLLVAPLSGMLLPIDRVPDPVFAQKMVGDGISIDPTSQILQAPCDGEVIQLHPSNHAITLRTAEGLEVLMHIGLDTVTLRGQGFSPKVAVGDRVKVGDPLIAFDADYVALHAVSLLTQVVITNSDRVAQFVPQTGNVVAGRDMVLELALSAAATGALSTEGNVVRSEEIVIPNPEGLHARPSAVLVNLAKKYKAELRLRRGNDQANARSVVALMGMQINRGDVVILEGRGDDAEGAIAELSEAIRSGLGEEGAKPMPAPSSIAQMEEAKPAPRPRSEDPNVILGVAASPGMAVGYLHQVKNQEIAVEEVGGTPNQEQRKLEQAIEQARLEVEALRAKVHGQGDPKKAAIFAAHQEILEDPEIYDRTASLITEGKSAAYAWKHVYTSQANQLAKLQNTLLAERANDLRDVGGRVLRILTGVTTETATYPEQTVLVAEDLTPSDMATLDRTRVIGFCTVAGGSTSHVAILARSMDIPAIAGSEERVMGLADGMPVILDGSKGRLRLNPSSEEMESTRQRIQRVAEKRKVDFAAREQAATTRDGHPIEVVANIGNQEEAEKSIGLGGEGVGLLRTEFVFMESASAPSEEVQSQIYGNIAAVMKGRPVIIRTLDVGGDKPLPYMPMPHEENPFLGERGIRIGFDRPEILRTQMRAILRASQQGTVRIMFPMIARLDEIRMAKAMLEEERQRLGVAPIEVGIMIEVPSAAVMADQFAQEVDFFSIGTNDLTQYTLAMDRGHPKLAPLIDGLDPGVLRLIDLTVRGASRYGKWVGVCGGIGSDPQAIPILIGLGVKELSVSIPTIPSIKAQIRNLSLVECRELASRALAAETAAAVRDLSPFIEE
ncbi:MULTISPECIES: phosphoenolpyruvate--protein phosphotransferase [unclassified Leptolyngbya]|uniref:phosphoenolpyruvate--protein phosphotransferase n=1 Tax=unclassified Leptolyngbya TaxID=2650499 RepID=UPI0016846915|nr:MULTISPECIES: phosphoenolpyruvate--protein phosphotransferase [unclassified Leptolyngbya]MBD1913381.1 phosphoenolpyruvate--protein phosphotransferase [Leptolyngbya sp. FACHB-8]MBD2158688.1 phosphoenolpyruvate--protein phosphotransferase [Leptolyngbya sp. FACHB-16]